MTPVGVGLWVLVARLAMLCTAACRGAAIIIRPIGIGDAHAINGLAVVTSSCH